MSPDEHENDMDDSTPIPQDAADALIASIASRPPAHLADRLADASATARTPGSPLALGRGAAEPIDAFVATAEELRTLLADLSADDWQAQTATVYGSVRDLVAHLAGSEDYCTRALARQPVADPVADFDHALCSQEVARSLAPLSNDELAAAWFALSMTFAEACRADPDTETVSLHQLPITIGGALVLRTFELWAHTEDICAATGRPLPRLDAARLSCMASRLVGAIGPLISLADDPTASGRLVLVGPGGGVAHVGPPLADGAQASVRIVIDIVDYCRVAARRLAAADLPCSIEGDDRLLRPLLAATAMFAKD